MGRGQSQAVHESFRTLFDKGTLAGSSDRELLEQFTAHCESAETAFQALVIRHGPLVWRVCRSLLDDANDADDAFQATFLVLARKARSIGRPELLGNWLYGTAQCVVQKLKREATRRRKHEARKADNTESRVDLVEHGAVNREHARLVHEELANLSTEARAAVLLCDLEGLPQEFAASRLRCSDRTLRRRLARAHETLRARLLRRGVDPTPGLLLAAINPESASAAISEGIAAATVQACAGVVVGKPPLDLVSPSVVALAEEAVGTGLWTNSVALALVACLVLAIVFGSVQRAGSGAFQESTSVRKTQRASNAATDRKGELPPAEQYRLLLKRHADALKAYGDEAEKLYREIKDQSKMQAAVSAAYVRLGPKSGDYAPRFLALARQYPKDPVAVDALIWVVEQTLRSVDNWEGDFSKSVGEAMEILARDHGGEPRLGPLCLKLITYESPNRDVFLKTISERSPNRQVKGQATLALAEYLKFKALHVEMIQNPDAPENIERERYMITAIFGPDALAGSSFPLSETNSQLRKERADLKDHAPAYLERLLKADPAVLRRESDEAYRRVLAEFGDIPYSRLDERPTKETLADAARRGMRPAPVGGKATLGESVNTLDQSFNLARKAADQAAGAAGPGEAGVRAYLAKAPKWADYGPKMWAIAESDPRHPDAYQALLWLVCHALQFFDAREERAATLGKAVDTLIRDHVDSISAHLAEREVAAAFNNGAPMPGPHVDRLFRALYERAPHRETRGRMGLALARHLKAEADLADSFALRGTDPECRLELAIWPPSYIERLRNADRVAMRRDAAAILERVEAEYGDVRYLYGMVVQADALAVIAGRELSELRTLAIGQVAPEIGGEDVEGTPMRLSEFRGKVVLLDFGSHEHCGGCKLVYPRLRAILEQYKGRPFVVLGINNNDRREVLTQARASGEITWRCWWDGDRLDGPGPITTRWNIQGYPSFIILDHRRAIRFKDVHPDDVRGFAEAVEPLLKAAANEPAAAERKHSQQAR
jgi:RNA polymerase sigma factor (sigma-70 family)